MRAYARNCGRRPALGLTLLLGCGAGFGLAQSSGSPEPELVVQSGHSGVMWEAVLSPDGRVLATSGVDQTIILWDVASGMQTRTLVGHTSGIDGLAFSPDGRLLATSGAFDRTLRIWDVASGRSLHRLTGHPEKINGLRFSPDGLRLASGGGDICILWDVASGRSLRTIEGCYLSRTPGSGLQFSPDDRWVAWQTEVTGTKVVQLMSLSSPAKPRTFAAKRKDQRLLFSFSPDSREIAVVNHDDKQCTLWSVDRDSARRPLVADDRGRVSPLAPPGPAFSPDGRLLATAGNDGVIRLWDVSAGVLRRSLSGHLGAPESLAFSRDGRWLASSGMAVFKDYTLRLWEVASGTSIWTAEPEGWEVLEFSPNNQLLLTTTNGSLSHFLDVGTGRRLYEIKSSRFGISLDSDWKLLAYAEGKGDAARLVDPATGRDLRVITRRVNEVDNLAISPDGRWIASAPGPSYSSDGILQVWDTVSGQLVRRVRTDSTEAVVFSPDSRELVSFFPGGESQPEFWDVLGGHRVKREAGVPGSKIGAVAFSPDGRLLAMGPRVWERSTQRLLFTLDQGREIEIAGFTPDSMTLVAAGRNRVKRWDMTDGFERANPFESYEMGPQFCAMSADASLVAQRETGGRSPYPIDVTDTRTGQKVCTLRSSDGVYGAAFSPDNLTLASATAGVEIWSLASCSVLHTLSGHSAIVNKVAFSPDGRHLLSGSDDGTIRIWDSHSGKQMAALLAMSEGLDWLAITPDGLFDGTPTAMQQLVAWRFGDDVVPPEAFFNEFYYPGLVTDILAGKVPKAPRSLAKLDRRQPLLRMSLAGGPGAGNPVSSRTVTVTIDVAEAPRDDAHPDGSGARDVRLFRNGALTRVWHGNVLPAQGGKVVLEATIPIVAGENRLSAYAFNHDSIKSADAQLVVVGGEALRRKGTAYVLAIGINQYANPDYNLNYSVADAKAFAEELRGQQTSLANFGQIEVVTLLDKDATKANIMRAFSRLAGEETGLPSPGVPAVLAKIKQAQPEDAVFVYYAGHGIAAGPRFYLVPHDLGYKSGRAAVDSAALETIYQHSVSDLDLERALERVDAGRLVLVVDACNSGQALEAEEKRRGPMNSKGLAQLAYEKGMYILAAAQGYQAAQEVAELGHGLLTYALVEEGLKTPAADVSPADSQVTLREWLDYAILRVPQMQLTAMQEARKAGREVAFVDGEAQVQELGRRNLQRPRIFYRREPEADPLVVARPPAKR